MKIGTITSRFSGNNANVTKGREWGTVVNSGFEMVATSTETYAYSGRVAMWDLTSCNNTAVILPAATNFSLLATNVDGVTLNIVTQVQPGATTVLLPATNLLVAILEGVDESHNTHLTSYEGTPLTVISLHDIEIELPYMGTYAVGGDDRLCLHVAVDANQGRVEWGDASDANHVPLLGVKITKIDTTRGLVRFICL